MRFSSPLTAFHSVSRRGVFRRFGQQDRRDIGLFADIEVIPALGALHDSHVVRPDRKIGGEKGERGYRERRGDEKSFHIDSIGTKAA